MSAQAPLTGTIAGVVVALLVGLAIIMGFVLSVESVVVGAAIGVLAGVGVGAVVVFAVGTADVPQGTRTVTTALGGFAWIALVLTFAISSTGIANMTALLAGIAVGALVGIASYFYLREQDSRNVNAVTMR